MQVMLQNSGNVDNLTGHYVFFLGCARCVSHAHALAVTFVVVPIERCTC
jgi:hypothetical protein